MNEPRSESDTVTWIRFEFARHVHAYLQDQIRFSDTKAGVTAAMAGVLFGAFRQLTLAPLQTFPPASPLEAAELAIALLVILFSLLSVLNAYRVLRPRLPASHQQIAVHHRFIERAADLFDRETRPTSRGQLINWAEIEGRGMGAEGPRSYASEVAGTPPTELIAQLSEHSVVLAMIAGQKYQHVRLALNNLLLAALSLVVLLLVVAATSLR
jgi:hypothetical protein